MSEAASIARALRGKPMLDGFLCHCPVPGHGKGNGDRNASLLVKDGHTALLVKCFAGCASADVLDALRQRGLAESAAKSTPACPLRNGQIEWVPEHKADPDAIAIWGSASKADGSIVEKYLRARGIILPVPPSIRCGARAYLDRFQLPAMVAAVQAPDRRTIAVQVTLIDPRGDRKAQVRLPRKTTGELGYGAVRLAAASDVLGLAEGVETALSAMQLTAIPCWACIGASRMHRVAVPDTVRELHIFGDNDVPGRAAVERAAHEHRHRRVVLHFPPDGVKDWNDALRIQAVAA
jgi:putative DNA primase/helicase